MMKDMMKKTGWLLLAASFLSSCSGNRGDLGDYELKGKVKSVFQRTYKAESKFGEWVEGEADNGDGFSDLDYFFNFKVGFDEKGLYEYYEHYFVSYNGDLRLSIKTIPVRENDMVVEISRYEEDGTLEPV